MKRNSETFFESNNYSKDYFLYKKSTKLIEEIEELTTEFKSLKTKYPQSLEYQNLTNLFKTQIITPVSEKPIPRFLLKFDDAIRKIGFLKPKDNYPTKIENIHNFDNKNDEYFIKIKNIQNFDDKNSKKIENIQNIDLKNDVENFQKISSDIDDNNEIINNLAKKTQDLQNLLKETDNELDCTMLYEDSLTCIQKNSNDDSQILWTHKVKKQFV